MRKIIDGFIFYNEMDMLEYRLNLLDEVVDTFILVESAHTFAGNSKPLLFEQNKARYAKFLHKIIHIIVDDFPFLAPNIDYSKNEQWRNENWQRNCITRGLDQIAGLDARDVILCSDLDEIPNPDMLHHVRAHNEELSIYTLVQDFYYYNLNSKIVSQIWTSARLFSYGTFQQLRLTLTDLRFYGCNTIQNAGWHLSYFGDDKFIENKIREFAHQELNNDNFTDLGKISARVRGGRDLYDRNDHVIQYIPVSQNPNLPPRYAEFLGKYYKHDE